ncbi:MAG: aldo/keto reductase [Bryobacterales bacterium]|nr:aldo/keto reductase [Bryobacterales bacterium]
MRRRIFVGGALAGLGAAHASPPKAKAGGIPMRTFGKTGVRLTVIGQAGGRFPLLTGQAEGRALVRHAYEMGINYFDNAHVYWEGRSEQVYGDALSDVRKNVFITTKSMGRTRKEAEDDLHASLRNLKTDYVDLWQIHGVSEMEEVDRIFSPGGAIEAFEAARKAGKCRFIGFTGHRDPHVHLAMLKRYDKYDSILMPLHAADPAYLSFEKLVLPVAVERGMAIQGMKNFANAKLLANLSVRECLSYVLSLPVHATAIGSTTIGQLEDDIRVAQNFKPLAADEVASIRKRAARMKGPGLEDWKRNVEARAGLDPRQPYRGA